MHTALCDCLHKGSKACKLCVAYVWPHIEGHLVTRLRPDHLCGVVQAEAQELIVACDCPQYLQKAERRLSEEVSRVREYLDVSTEAKVTRVAETALIQQQVRSLVLLGRERAGKHVPAHSHC